jgi:hypothetical protein
MNVSVGCTKGYGRVLLLEVFSCDEQENHYDFTPERSLGFRLHLLVLIRLAGVRPAGH